MRITIFKTKHFTNPVGAILFNELHEKNRQMELIQKELLEFDFNNTKSIIFNLTFSLILTLIQYSDH